VTEAEIAIDYLDPDGFKRTHTVRAEFDGDDFAGEVLEATEDIAKGGFFPEMGERRYVFIPPNQILRMTFDLIDTEDGS
jgi:hypothetical protein